MAEHVIGQNALFTKIVQNHGLAVSKSKLWTKMIVLVAQKEERGGQFASAVMEPLLTGPSESLLHVSELLLKTTVNQNQ